MPLAVLLNPDDPMFAFEHAIQHRQYFSLLEQLSQKSVAPYLLDPSLGMDLAAENWNLNHQQAHDDFNNDLPSTYENGYYLTHQVSPPATGTGNSTGTTDLAITGVSGTILIGAVVVGDGVPAGTRIIAQQSGPAGGDGTYTTSVATLLSKVALTITLPPYYQANPLTAGTFGIPQSQILLEGSGGTPENRTWWTFVNHQQHFIANNAVLPLPTTQPLTAGTPPGVEIVSNPWWWTEKYPLLYPFW